LQNYEIMFFNRWGQEVWASNNPTEGWDGRDHNGNNVPEGVYVFSMTYTNLSGDKIMQTGNVTVLR